MAVTDVSVIALPGVSPFEFGVAVEGFGLDRTAHDLPVYDFAVVTADPGPLDTRSGFTIETEHRLDRTATSDLLIVPAAGEHDDWDPRVLQALVDAVDRGARVMSICSGASSQLLPKQLWRSMRIRTTSFDSSGWRKFTRVSA